MRSRTASAARRLVALAVLTATTCCINALQLTTTAKSKLSPSDLQEFIATPTNWPKIVLSSNRAELVKQQRDVKKSGPLSNLFGVNNKSEDASPPTTTSVTPGDKVEEYFALNLFCIEWTCQQNTPGKLYMASQEGVGGIATDCVMDFEFIENGGNASESDDEASAPPPTTVTLTMEYTPSNILAVVATPALVVDNWLALNVLLPMAAEKHSTTKQPIDDFRSLMGNLYGIAGMAHLLDVTLGGSRLFAQAGIPEFWELPIDGQAYALLWCAVGPLAFVLSQQSAAAATAPSKASLNQADLGLIIYGAVEVLGAYLGTSDMAVFQNAVGVQTIVLAAWIYSYQKGQEEAFARIE